VKVHFGDPIVYWEDGSVKWIREYIVIEGFDVPEIVKFIIHPPLLASSMFVDENVPPTAPVVKKAIFRRREPINCEGYGFYYFEGEEK
jgi:hypothetical protein